RRCSRSRLRGLRSRRETRLRCTRSSRLRELPFPWPLPALLRRHRWGAATRLSSRGSRLGSADKINGRATMRIALLAAAALVAVPLNLATAVPAIAQEATDPALSAALAHSRRDADRARDVHRHPAETLTFFQVKPGMTVVDYMPAGGWYSRVLIPYLGENGTYISLNPELHPEMTGYWDTYRGTAEKFPAEAR